MHLRKWRSFFTRVKEIEANPVIKQNVLSYFDYSNIFTDWKTSKQ